MGMVYTEIADWIKERPSISLRGLEKEADLPLKTLSHYVNGRRELNEQHLQRLIPVLERYGWESKN